MNFFLTLALLTASAAHAQKDLTLVSDGDRFHYAKNHVSDARKVAGFVHQAKAAMIQEFAQFQPGKIIQSISLDVYIHDQPNQKAGIGSMHIMGAGPCGSHVCKKYVYSIDLLAPSLWPPNPQQRLRVEPLPA